MPYNRIKEEEYEKIKKYLEITKKYSLLKSKERYLVSSNLFIDTKKMMLYYPFSHWLSSSGIEYRLWFNKLIKDGWDKLDTPYTFPIGNYQDKKTILGLNYSNKPNYMIFYILYRLSINDDPLSEDWRSDESISEKWKQSLFYMIPNPILDFFEKNDDFSFYNPHDFEIMINFLFPEESNSSQNTLIISNTKKIHKETNQTELKDNLPQKRKNNKFSKKPLIITEGKTDWKHLEKAFERFQNKNEYLKLDIQFEKFENISMSDSELDNYVQTHAKQINLQKIICIFDRDLPERVKEYGQYDFVHVANKQLVNTIKDKCKKEYGKSSKKYLNIVEKIDSFQYDMIDSELRDILTGKEYREWEIQLKNNVYAFCIPKLSDELDEICIEFYYKEKDLKTEDAKGKRLFIADEFKFNKENSSNCNRFISKCGKYKTDTQSGKNHNRHVTLQYPNKNNYGYVYKIEEKECNKSNNMNLSKNDFAKNIINDVKGFDNFDIENFRLIFDIIEKIVND